MASGSKKVKSIRAVLANFDISRNSASKQDCETKRPCKIPAKTPSEVAGEDGIDSDINFKKRNKLSFSAHQT